MLSKIKLVKLFTAAAEPDTTTNDTIAVMWDPAGICRSMCIVNNKMTPFTSTEVCAETAFKIL